MYSYFINKQKTTKKKTYKNTHFQVLFFSFKTKRNTKKPNKYKKRRKHKLKNILVALWVGKEDKTNVMGSIFMHIAVVTVFAQYI